MNKFPEGFYWGAATASYQVEGWNQNTDWAAAARQGIVPPAGRLADHYHRYEEDFDIAVELGHNAHRLSIEWARIEPREGQWDTEEIEHYRQVLRALRARNLEPFVTLWHFTLPQWFAETGGFLRPDAPELFARYCTKVMAELGDECTHVSTMNEPNVYATHGYIYGAWPPFKRIRIGWVKVGKEDGSSERTRSVARFSHLFAYLRVSRNLAAAHNKAYTAIKKANPKIQVSVIKHVHYFYSNHAWFNKLAAKLATHFQTHVYMKRVINHLDEIGLNYYRHTKFGETQNYLCTDMEWKVYPSGIYGALKLLGRYQKPIFVAEAGIADRDDDLRGDYIEVQLKAIKRALDEGIDVRGHMYWSLIDNYEWALGIDKKFGLVHIDYKTLARTIRPSAWEYKRLIETYSATEASPETVDTPHKKAKK